MQLILQHSQLHVTTQSWSYQKFFSFSFNFVNLDIVNSKNLREKIILNNFFGGEPRLIRYKDVLLVWWGAVLPDFRHVLHVC